MNEISFIVTGENRSDKVFDAVNRGATKMMSSIAGMLAPMAKAALAIGTMAATAVSAAPVLAPIGAALFSLGQAAAGAAPALLAFAAAGAFVKLTLTAIFKEGSAMQKALDPLKKGFAAAGEAASKAAAAGVRPLAEEMRKAVMPAVEASMVRIGDAVNKVARGFMEWAKSKDGVKSIRGIVEPIGEAMNDLAPALTRVTISFVKMLGRIMGVSAAAGESGLTKVLDGVADKLDKINEATVRGAALKLGEQYQKVLPLIRTLAGWLDKLRQAYKMYTTEFLLVADAVSVLAIAFGGPVIATIAAIGLIIRHFDEFQAAWEGLKKAFSGDGGGGPLSGFMDNMRAFGDEVLPSLKDAFLEIKEAVLPVLQDIGHQIKDKLIPAFGEFIEAASPVVSWLIDVLGPVVAQSFGNILRIISGAIDIIVGIFKVFTAILKGDWGKAWEGIQDILKGAGKILGALIRQVGNLVTGAFKLLAGVVVAIWKRLFDLVASAVRGGLRNAANVVRAAGGWFADAGRFLRDALLAPFKGAGGWLVNVGKWMVHGLAKGISAVGGWVMSAIRSIIPDFLEGYIPGFAHGGISGGGLAMVGERGRELVKLPTGAQVYPNGQTERMLAGGGAGATKVELVIHSGGTGLDDLLIEIIRKSVRVRAGSGPNSVQVALGGAT